MPDRITIGEAGLGAAIVPQAGGRVAQITTNGVPLLIDRDDVPPGEAGPLAWGAYAMVPWAGRIRRGRFDFDGSTHQLPTDGGGHAIHGVGLTSPWEIVERGHARVVLTLALPAGPTWPFGGRATERIEIADGGIELSIAATAGDRAMPLSLGWHPWFRRPERLEFHPESMYRRDAEGITVDDIVDVPDPPWDDCFVNREPIRARIDGVDVLISSAASHWVIYTARHATCVEPQTAPPDAFNIRPHRLRPGETSELSMTIRVDR